MVKTKIEIESSRIELSIKLINAAGMFKTLVLDMNVVEGRLLYIGEGLTADEAYQDAYEFVMSYELFKGQVWQ